MTWHVRFPMINSKCVILSFKLADILSRLRTQAGYLSSGAEAVLKAVDVVKGLPNLGKVLLAVTPFMDNIISVIKKKTVGILA